MNIKCNGIEFPLEYALNHNMIDDPIVLNLANQIESLDNDYNQLQIKCEGFEGGLHQASQDVDDLLYDLEADIIGGMSQRYDPAELIEDKDVKRRYQHATTTLAELSNNIDKALEG